MTNTQDNTLDTLNYIARKTLEQRADLFDQAAFAFITKQFDYLVSIGEDPTQYVVTLESRNGIDMMVDGYRILNRVKMRKIEEADVYR